MHLKPHPRYRPLGLRPAEYDDRTLHMSSYLGPVMKLSPPPASASWSKKVDAWPMFMNDVIGDCAIAGPAHMLQCWGKNDGNEVRIVDEDVLKAYREVSGYDPSDPSTDEGCVMIEVLRYWRKIGIAGFKIGAFGMVDAKNKALVKQAIFLFGGLNAGLQLPECAQNQKVWDVPASGARGQGRIGSWGGHCVNLVDYDQDVLTCVTWGATQKMTWRFLHTYCTELYAVLDETWTGPDKKAPNGFELAALQRDLRLVTRP